MPIIKYNAKEGRFFARNRNQQPDGTYASEEIEIPLPLSLLVDFQSLEIGWVCLKDGQFDMRYVPYPLDMQLAGTPPDCGPRPSAGHNMGFRMLVKTREGEIRHFGHSSMIVYKAFSALHDAFLAAPEAKDTTKSPVLRVERVEPVTGKHGKNYEPKFALGRFTDRPEEFDDHQPEPVFAEEFAPAGSNNRHPDSTGEDDLPF